MVLAFTVEAFVLQLEQSKREKEKAKMTKKKILERTISVTDDTDCVEGIIRAWLIYIYCTCI